MHKTFETRARQLAKTAGYDIFVDWNNGEAYLTALSTSHGTIDQRVIFTYSFGRRQYNHETVWKDFLDRLIERFGSEEEMTLRAVVNGEDRDGLDTTHA